jgi:hypothetical protein
MKDTIRHKIELAKEAPLVDLFTVAEEDCLSDVMSGKVYKLTQIAELWQCSHEFVRRQFIREPGVVKFRGIYLVPECVLQRCISRSMIRRSQCERSRGHRT